MKSHRLLRSSSPQCGHCSLTDSNHSGIKTSLDHLPERKQHELALIDRKVKSAPLGLIVHTLEEVNEQLQKGHYFFTDNGLVSSLKLATNAAQRVHLNVSCSLLRVICLG
ncbi:hypothetical protein [Vibrio gazogenes]|uniref:Uncharacterized protein n=1 Tax=Vibrio gazogenes DSM 21264 = NBRC 103151 TaxID=1123492 RepID=A0A1M4V0S2_VIBGA|nr:hypothetical protein [Vibrio gazogenes]USP15639.1 hypothetical protein MKS89_19825 [Vibrio gazogenes]SHE62545.1 hypothetical protein SAMN02745781_00610 [Vibrio gazogenes DSM 21264] [Vibrio gazogenes DSM 21264 = NBRC 103151]SJN57857.1 hypothetical protein BQ6471_02760 [Vibrio gazogenes]